MLREARFWTGLLVLVAVFIGRVYRLQNWYMTDAVYFELLRVALDMLLLRRLLELL